MYTCNIYIMSPRRKNVREPVQVYLDEPDRRLLEELAIRTGLSRAELLRRGIRRLADAYRNMGETDALTNLIGALGDHSDLPQDLAENHDRYLYGADPD